MSSLPYSDADLLALRIQVQQASQIPPFEDNTANLQQNGTASVGTIEKILRSDFTAPKDTTKSDKLFTINAQTGTTYTLQLTDSDSLVTMSNASVNILTIPTNASVAFLVGTKINIIQRGTGITTIKGDTGVSLNDVSAGTAVCSGQFEGITIYKEATDSWIAVNK